MKGSMVTETSSGLWCAAGGFHMDPGGPVHRAGITPAHGDHARPGSSADLCAAACAGRLRRRFGDVSIEPIEYGRTLTLGGVRISFHPAGHVLGSAQIRIESSDGVTVIAGDYKRAA